jgi:predicted dehydrogenase
LSQAKTKELKQMKKIGFIDYYIDEWHANNYPKWFSEAPLKDKFTVAYAWEEAPKEGLRPLKKWCDDFKIAPAKSVEKIVEDCDALCVLAPSNPEVHERLAEIPLKSGKPVYIDKPFAPDRAAAERLFSLAEKHKTPLMSSSALRWGSALQKAVRETFKEKKPDFAGARGCGRSFWEYSIHQVEMITALLGTGAQKLMQCGNDSTNHMVIEYSDGRRACMTLMPDQGFQISAANDKNAVVISEMSDFFPGLIDHMLRFFDSGVPPIDKNETIEIAAIVAAGIKALKKPGSWVRVN